MSPTYRLLGRLRERGALELAAAVATLSEVEV